jgi:hypothetical protein
MNTASNSAPPSVRSSVTPRQDGHLTSDQNRQLRALNDRYRPMLSASNQVFHAADSARKQVEASYMRERQEILRNGNGHVNGEDRT